MEGKAILEGLRLVQDGLHRDVKFAEVLCSESFYMTDAGNELAEKLRGTGADIILVPDSLVARISDTETPQGIIASFVIEPFFLEEVLSEPTSLVLILDEVRDPGNVGTLLRTAAALGVSCVILTKGCADVYAPKTLRSSMGTIFAVPIIENVSCSTIISKIKTLGMRLVVTAGNGEISCHEPWYVPGTCLVLGNEAHGVNDEFFVSADASVRIPMMRGVESLNVSIAGSILLYEAYRQGIPEQG
jgi:TrmH family RNA methyltransferase